MSVRFRNRYRIPSARLPGHDYAASGLYFVTSVSYTHLTLPTICSV